MRLSVVIPAYNAAATIGEQLTALTEQHWDDSWEVIVADNGSTDDLAGVVRGYADRLPGLRIVDASERRGAAFARNAGVRAANGDAILFTDADDVVGAGWLTAMGRALEQHDFVAGRKVSMRSPLPSSMQDASTLPPDRVLQRLRYPPYVQHAGGSMLGVRRELFLRAGGFDESLLYLEDTDFCIRLQLDGVPLHPVPEAVVRVRPRNRLFGEFVQVRNWECYNVLLAKRYRSEGESSSLPAVRSWFDYLARWASVAWLLSGVGTAAGRRSWVRRLARQVGVLQGCVFWTAPPV